MTPTLLYDDIHPFHDPPLSCCFYVRMQKENQEYLQNILLTSPSEIQGRSFIIKTANGDKSKAYATDPEAIQLLINNYHGLNNMFAMGRLVIGNGGFNSPWSWHLDPDHATMAEFAIEL